MQDAPSQLFVKGDTDTDNKFDPDETWTFSASGTASAGQYSNIGYAKGTYYDPYTLDATVINVSDPDNYYGSSPAISIVKKTNDTNNNTAPGLYVPTGNNVTWSYEVKNTGNVTLTDIVVKDDNGTAITTDDFEVGTIASLAPGASATLTHNGGNAQAGQYTNLGSVTGKPPVGDNVTASDPDNYYGSSPAISIVKKTNDTNNNTAPGLYVPTGNNVTWSYEVKNTGNVTLTDIVVKDDNGTAITTDDFEVGTIASLAPGASATLTHNGGNAQAGQYTNLGSVTGKPPVGDNVTASDPDNYYGSSPAISIVKKTNDTNNNTAPGLYVPTGNNVTWSYEVKNTGNVTLTDIVVKDDNGTAITTDDFEVGTIASLAPGASATLTHNGGNAQAGQYTNLGSVTGKPPVGDNVTASDPDNYYGSSPAISIVKKTNDTNNNTAPGLYVPTGNNVTWSYEVKNTGNVTLTDIVVKDDNGTAITTDDFEVGTIASLAPGASATLTHNGGNAQAGQYTNLGSVTGKPPVGDNVTASDPDNYYGSSPAISIVKKTNDTNNKTAPGLYVPTGNNVTWSYEVKNTGNVTLTDIVVKDDNGTAITTDDFEVGTIASLAPGASATLTTTVATARPASTPTSARSPASRRWATT